MNEIDKLKRLIRVNIAITLLVGATVITLLTMYKTSDTITPSSKAINEQITSLEKKEKIVL